MVLLPEKARAKRVAKVDKIHQKMLQQMEKRDKALWKQAALGYDPQNLQKWKIEEGAIAKKIESLKAEMVKKLDNPLELFPPNQVVWHAAKYGMLNILQGHLPAPGAVDFRDSSTQNTPLHVASFFGHLDCVQTLVHARTDVNATNAQGYSALLSACEQHRADVVQFLLSIPHLDPYIRTPTGLSAWQLIRKNAVLGDKWSQYAKCVRALDARCAIISGWLFESQRGAMINRLVLENVGLKAHTWHQRHVVVTRIANSPEVDFAIYETPSPNAYSAVPLCVIAFTLGDPITTPIPKRTLNNKPHSFAFDGHLIFPTSLPTKESFEFAALSEEAFAMWMQFFENLFLQASSATTTATTEQPPPTQSRVSQPPLSPVQTMPSNEIPDIPYEELFPVAAQAIPVAVEVTKSVSFEPAAPSAPDMRHSMLESMAGQLSLQPAPAPLYQAAVPSSPKRPSDCVVCFDAPQEGVCVPCGHNAVCMTCAPRILAQKACPVCRAEIREIIRIYQC
ncbi:Aste57867_19098 [Aphanomyces stellatus]|uniref:Aste57867_19098 protein n=1 Tax=Aphanomyces stellatus TaxID=120398 RepID=A0A485LBZ8_9STRA|nr:hypothetical protein As57867_019034 [Aphanomyces stellatus]VFT95823.1 Aste57867_19098 [Aphanomyces stellatus]